MMHRILRLSLVLALVPGMILLAKAPALAFEESAIQLSFSPEQDYSSRYMFQLMMWGQYTSPGMELRWARPEGGSGRPVARQAARHSSVIAEMRASIEEPS